MAEHEKDLHISVLYRGKPSQLTIAASSTLGDLGEAIVDLTGVAPHTLRLMLPKRPLLQPLLEQHSSNLLHQSGITEGLTVRVMGASLAEVAAVSKPSARDLTLGFSEEEQRAKRRAGTASNTYALPQGNYIFCGFQTLSLPGIELNPPAAMALKIMHKLCSDRGVVAIMNKHRWRVGIMTEMAPVGYVGISPKCILGFNKNRGEEISLRLRTDDLKGFRKYESIKKTLLHELAHMVRDEHDEKFHSLDKQLNEEAVALDWTKSKGHTWGRVKMEDEEEEMETVAVRPSTGHRLGGNVEQTRSMSARAAASAAALRRFGVAGNVESSQKAVAESSMAGGKSTMKFEPDPDDQDSESMLVIDQEFSKRVDQNVNGESESIVIISERSQEPDPDDAGSSRYTGANEPCSGGTMDLDIPMTSGEPAPDASSRHIGKEEPDPDDALLGDSSLTSQYQNLDVPHGYDGKYEPDPDDAVDIVLDVPAKGREPDPDDAEDIVLDAPTRSQEPDPDDEVDIVLHGSTSSQEPDSGDASGVYTGRSESDPDDARHAELKMPLGQEPDPDDMDDLRRDNEPDPDDSSESDISRLPSVNMLSGSGGLLHVGEQNVQSESEPDPDASCKNAGERGLTECRHGCRHRALQRMKSGSERTGLNEFVN